MKKVLCLLLSLLNLGFVFANDTYFFTSGGNLVPAEEKDIKVQMKSEIISIVLNPKYYEVTVDFDFYNHGDKVELLVGFPFFEAGIGGHGKIYDFKCWTNGVLTDYSDMPLVRNFSNNNYDAAELENAYTRKIVFPDRKQTKTKVNYKSEYGYDVDGLIISYLYGTGRSWFFDIGEMTVIIENNLPYSRPDELVLPGKKEDFKRVKDNVWEAHFYKIEPEYTDCIRIHAKDILDDTGPKRFPAYGYKFQKVKANADSLFWYTKPQLRIMRNTIYALHGYDFKSKDLKELFNDWGKYWYPKYTVNPDFSEDDFTEIEKYNIELLLKEEAGR